MKLDFGGSGRDWPFKLVAARAPRLELHYYNSPSGKYQKGDDLTEGKILRILRRFDITLLDILLPPQQYKGGGERRPPLSR